MLCGYLCLFKTHVALRHVVVFIGFYFFLKYFLMYLCVVVLIRSCNACIDTISFSWGVCVCLSNFIRSDLGFFRECMGLTR